MLPVCVEWLSWCVPPEPWHRERVEEEGMSHPLQSPFTRRMAALLLLAMLAAISPRSSGAQAHPAQDAPAKSDSTPQAPAAASPPDANNTSEVSTHDNPATFRVRVNLVLVRVVVRDSQGKVITGLKKEDFQLSDNRKPQVISTFSVETPESHKVAPSTPAEPAAEADGDVSAHAAEVSYYQADLIENKHDSQALAVATEDALSCAFNDDPRMTQQAQQMAQAASARALASGDAQIEYVYRHLEEAMRRLSVMPGQRILALVSPGFIVTTLTLESSDLVDRANRANIVINTIDARGLYAPDLLDAISDPPHDSMRTAGFKSTYRISAQNAQMDILAQLADGTGGTFFHNRNDVDEGLRQAAAAPAVSYLLGFSPQNLKVDGRYHTLKVALTSKQKYAVQARHGYYAPRSIADPVEAAKEEIQEALFSQDEIHDLPVELQTQFFRRDEAQARLAVLTHVDIKGIRFRKTEGRNR